eukprot:CAMPEP_0183722990 /NCGR_PEP_ID=MMETSP0737-20130205/14756_1 /TAXON_ID=385413 /ORGANISM="Thalassiosira miniscula, Strain CCMP1093" /LENGTH=646 /DNA_ID=CAMNT_0025953239 /DNA_START=128 /DNA_END=2068 /DNA_ORIENTATION=+
MSSSPYNAAGRLLSDYLEKGRGLKSIAFDNTNNGKNKKKNPPSKATYATVCKTVQHLPIIHAVLDANGKKLRKSIGFDSVHNKGLFYVMIYELLFSKYQKIRGGGKIKRMIVQNEKQLRKEAEAYISKHGPVLGDGVGMVAKFPRYIRVNTLRSNVVEIVDQLNKDLASNKTDKQTKASKDGDDDGDDNEDKKGEEGQSPLIYVDAHVPDLLVLHPSASSWLHRDYDPVKSGKIVLQDKSSCFSALAMVRGLVGSSSSNDSNKSEQEGECFDYIDACAAPGNKTSHLAALVHSLLGDDSTTKNTKKSRKKGKGKASKPKSTIFAFERNSTRHGILSQRMEQFVPSPADNGNKVAVEPIHGDFLKADPSDPKFANVRAIMLDPSCSGSGIVNSPDRDNDDAKDTKRIEALSNFQLVALKHAMSFPNVDRIVYSTCSVHDEENECVVSKALAEVMENEPKEDGDEWELVAPVCLEHWPRRGKEGGIGGLTKAQAECLIRCDGLDGDETNGFFVSFFARKKISQSTGGADSAREPIESAGIPLYNGQFKEACKQGGDTNAKKAVSDAKMDTAVSKEEEEVVTPKEGKKQKVPTKKNERSAAKASDKSAIKAKKREKKLAWKRKQALQKAERMKKKKMTEAASKEQKNSE